MEQEKKKTKNYGTIIISVIALLISLFALLDTRSVSVSNILVSEDSVKVFWDENNSSLAFIPVLKNIGKTPAKDVSFKIYLLAQTLAASSTQSTPIWDTVFKGVMFNDSLVADLQPEQEATFGNIRQEVFNRDNGGANLFLVYHLEYTDTLFSAPLFEKKHKFYFFKYVIGNKSFPDKVVTLISTDFNNIKNPLLSLLENDKDIELASFIKSK